MRKTFILFLVALFVISCDGPIQQPLDTKLIVDLVVNQNDWVESTDNDGLNRYYTSSFIMKEINSTVYNDGAVIAYIEIDNKQQILPYVRHYENADGIMWTKTVDFDYSNGKVTFYVTNSDFAVDPPETMYFRVILMW